MQTRPRIPGQVFRPLRSRLFLVFNNMALGDWSKLTTLWANVAVLSSFDQNPRFEARIKAYMGTNSTLLCIHRDPNQLGLLKEHGHELVTATNGSDGLRLLMSRPVDAVVLEHHLCLVDGASVADKIKQARPDVPVVMVFDHVDLPTHDLKSVDALVVESDGPHFLLATVHFILNVKPVQRREAMQRFDAPPKALRSPARR